MEVTDLKKGVLVVYTKPLGYVLPYLEEGDILRFTGHVWVDEKGMCSYNFRFIARPSKPEVPEDSLAGYRINNLYLLTVIPEIDE